ncbi:acyl carrier protein [Streptomyces decoyicus]|uniref:acyl carrier protein n=1 Tax=Streptomyces decoyicus TaxID=249567 RepID=UPI0033A80622
MSQRKSHIPAREAERAIISVLCSVPDAEPGDFSQDTRVVAHSQWDSLNSLETMVAIEGALGVRLDLRAYHACRTVGDLVSLVTGKGPVG